MSKSNMLSNLLEQAQLSDFPRGDYDLPEEMFERWAARPADVDPKEHAHYCSDGALILKTGDSTNCPVCAYRDAFARLRQSLLNCGIDPLYLNKTWRDLRTDLEPFGKMRAACERAEGMLSSCTSLLLWGDHGSGKTQVAMLLARAVAELGKTVQVASLGEVASMVRAGFNDIGEGYSEPKAVKHLADADLLVLEDLGASETRNAEIEKRVLWLALNKRHNFRRSTIVTTNLNPGELTHYCGQRIYARLQPLYRVQFSHGVNFRAEAVEAKPWW